jgi:hypothetical protein
MGPMGMGRGARPQPRALVSRTGRGRGSRTRGAARLAAITALVAVLPGCVSVQRETHDPLLAAGVAAHPYERLLRMVSLDRTPRDEVLALLGTPHSVTRTEAGTELLRWDAPRATRTRIAVLPLVAVDLDGRRISSVYVEIADGTVRRYWSEEG